METGYAVIAAAGGSEPYQYVWADGSTGASRSNLMPGDYEVNVTDANGCTITTSVTVNPVLNVTAEITDPGQINCGAVNTIGSSATNATGFSWNIADSDGSWSVSDSAMNQAMVTTGNGSAILIFNAWNGDGCQDSDTLIMVCQSDTTGNGSGDSGDGDGNAVMKAVTTQAKAAAMPTAHHIPGRQRSARSRLLVMIASTWNFWLKLPESLNTISPIWSWDSITDISDLSNSENWKTEVNTTDPKSGIYGFKIDDISGFRKFG